MKTDDKLKIVDALIDIKLVLAKYNDVMNNGFGYTDADFDLLKKAFDGTKNIAVIVRKY